MRWGRLETTNYRGAPVPRTLGIWLAVAATAATAVVAVLDDVGAAGWGALAGCLLVFAAGLVDDLAPSGPRGLRDHLRSLASGRMTTGILKVVVTVGAGAVVIAMQPSRPGYVRVCGIVLLAAAANVGNGLDVRPGRALKAFVVPGMAFLVWGTLSHAPPVAGLLVGSVGALPFDLRERAMLGDAGANLLGFAAGLGLFDVLPDAWIAPVAVLAVLLNVVADTVSLSRVIDATPPLRYLDGLGRRT
jgi:hypothetical protein